MKNKFNMLTEKGKEELLEQLKEESAERRRQEINFEILREDKQ